MRQHDPPRNTHRLTAPIAHPAHPVVQPPLERAVGALLGPESSSLAIGAFATSGHATHAQSPSHPAPSLRLLLTIPEAAKALGMGRTFVYALVMQGELLSVKVGRTRRVPVKALLDYVERLTTQQGEEG